MPYKFNPFTNKLDIINDPTVISKTYAQLAAMVTGSQLVIGQQYLLTDFYTKYVQPVTGKLKVGPDNYDVATPSDHFEQIVLTAISTSSFDTEVQSLTNQGHTLIYDFTNNDTGYGGTEEENFRPGWIERRFDTVRNVSLPFDYKKILLARYRPDSSAIDEFVPAKSEILEIDFTGLTSAGLGGKYFLISDTSTDYYVWFNNVDIGNTDPAVPDRIGIGVFYSATGTDIPSLVNNIVSSVSGPFLATPDGNKIIISPSNSGEVFNPTADIDTGAIFTIIQTGTNQSHATLTAGTYYKQDNAGNFDIYKCFKTFDTTVTTTLVGNNKFILMHSHVQGTNISGYAFHDTDIFPVTGSPIEYYCLNGNLNSAVDNSDNAENVYIGNGTNQEISNFVIKSGNVSSVNIQCCITDSTFNVFSNVDFPIISHINAGTVTAVKGHGGNLQSSSISYYLTNCTIYGLSNCVFKQVDNTNSLSTLDGQVCTGTYAFNFLKGSSTDNVTIGDHLNCEFGSNYHDNFWYGGIDGFVTGANVYGNSVEPQITSSTCSSFVNNTITGIGATIQGCSFGKGFENNTITGGFDFSIFGDNFFGNTLSNISRCIFGKNFSSNIVPGASGCVFGDDVSSETFMENMSNAYGIGNTTRAVSNDSVAIGSASLGNKERSVGVGYNARAFGPYTTVLGSHGENIFMSDTTNVGFLNTYDTLSSQYYRFGNLPQSLLCDLPIGDNANGGFRIATTYTGYDDTEVGNSILADYILVGDASSGFTEYTVTKANPSDPTSYKYTGPEGNVGWLVTPAPVDDEVVTAIYPRNSLELFKSLGNGHDESFNTPINLLFAIDRFGKISLENYSKDWKFGDVTGGDYSEFEADGTLKFNGNATVWNDINLPLSSLAPGATGPGNFTIPSTNLIVKAFTGTGTTQSAHGSCEILHDYKEGSDIVPHIHWCPTTTGAGNVKWQLEYAWINNSGTVTTSTTISVIQASSTVVGQEHKVAFPTISGAGKTIGSRFIFRLFRDASDVADTYGSDAGAFDFGIHYERDTTGSRQITSK